MTAWRLFSPILTLWAVFVPAVAQEVLWKSGGRNDIEEVRAELGMVPG